MNGEIMSIRRMGPGIRGWVGGESCGGRKMSKEGLRLNLVGWDGHSDIVSNRPNNCLTNLIKVSLVKV